MTPQSAIHQRETLEGRIIQPLPDPTPSAYRVIRCIVECRHCASHHEYPQMYAVYKAPSRFGLKTLKQFKPINTLTFNLPVEYKEKDMGSVPFCHECYDSFSIQRHIETLPLPPIEDSKKLLHTPSPVSLATIEAEAKKPSAPKKASLTDIAGFFK